MKIAVSHPTGNQNSREAARAFAANGSLAWFATSLHFDSSAFPWSALPGRWKDEFARRDFWDIGGRVLQLARTRETVRLLSRRASFFAGKAEKLGWGSIDATYDAVDAGVASELRRDFDVSAVYAYEDGAWQSFKAATARGLKRFYELPIGHWKAHQAICTEEADLQPAWADTWLATQDSEFKLSRKDEELAMATLVIVPSRFVVSTLEPLKLQSRVHVVPYGFPQPAASTRSMPTGTLKVLFVGGLSQRKGLAYLLEAMKLVGSRAELTVIGIGPGARLLEGKARLLGSLPRPRVLEVMRTHDVLVFPTLFEGFSLVVGEAMSQGLPVITTANSGAGDIIEDGKDGWLVPIRNAASIARILVGCIEDPDRLHHVSNAALQKAALAQWSRYRTQLFASVSSCCER